MTKGSPAHEKSLPSLLTAQFFGAFNDNAWKLIVTFLAIRSLQNSTEATHFTEAAQLQTTIAFSTLTLPLILFSLPAGMLADRISKRSLIVLLKGVEIVLMGAGTFVLAYASSQTVWLFGILGLMGVHSALFSPAKYGIIPELLPHSKLSAGNAQLELWTFIAIVFGTAIGGLLLDLSGSRLWIAGVFLLTCSCIGFLAALRISKVPAARASGDFSQSISTAYRAIRADRILFLAVLGSVFYWTIASLLGQNILVYSKTILHLSDTFSGVPLAIFGLGVGIGSLLAARLSGPKVEYGLIPLGAVGLALSTLCLFLVTPTVFALWTLMCFAGVSSGFIVVPLQALQQWRAPNEYRGAVIALSNVFVFSGVFIGSLSASGLTNLGLNPSQLFLVSALCVFAGTLWAIKLLPDALLRLALVLLTHSFYRLRIIGRDQVPSSGGVLLVPNHVSFVDALILMASIDRPIRFIVDSSYFENPFLKPFMKFLGTIPISASGGPRIILKALRDAGKYIDEGEVVCIFPEGQLTRTGTLLPFRRGLERIVENRQAVIVPVYMDKVWGSIFSREGGRFLTKLPKRMPYPITVAFGDPLPPGTPLHEIRQAVQETSSMAWSSRRETAEPLPLSFVRNTRRNPFRFLFGDAQCPTMSRGKALISTIALARALRKDWGNQERVGILLPSSVGGVLVNLAATFSGRTSVNLNFTAGLSGMTSAAAQAALSTVVTNRVFLEKAECPLPSGVRPIWAEDLRSKISAFDRWQAFLIAFFVPARWIPYFCGAKKAVSPDDVATIIFSSGSTGEPKGVQLTHFNIDSNTEAVAQVVRPESGDKVLGILPLFHSFGYFLLWFACNENLGMPLHPNPLDAPAIGEIVQRHRISILLATPTFLQIYMRRCTPAEFGSLRLVITGAEKLSERLAASFEDQFGIRPMDGYGATECSPGVALNVPDFRSAGFYQPGSKRGFVGQPLPGVAIKIVDPETGVALPPNTPGMLLVKGPNIMKGYLNQEALTQKVLHNGWYTTGDIALVDEDGFLKITDRLARFSKIGGEMVPHGKIEEALHEVTGLNIQTFAVTAVSDERKGEMLAVVHTYSDDKVAELTIKLAHYGLPNLFIPRKESFVKVDSLPLLGTGKLNLREVKQIAQNSLKSV